MGEEKDDVMLIRLRGQAREIIHQRKMWLSEELGRPVTDSEIIEDVAGHLARQATDTAARDVVMEELRKESEGETETAEVGGEVQPEGGAAEVEAKIGSYYEDTVQFGGDPLACAAKIAVAAATGDYVLYENGEGWSLGMDPHAEVVVYPDWTVLNVGDDKRVYRNSDLPKTIDAAVSSAGVDKWRAYGITNFELAVYNHGLELDDKKAYLAKLFIPRREVRFANGGDTLLLRALDQQDLAKLRGTVEGAVNSSEPDRFENPKVLTMEDLPEIDTHGAEKYKSIVAGALKEIRSHQYRKVILSRKVPIRQSVDMPASYVVGRRANTPSRSYLLSMDGLQAAGFSPETVVVVDDKGEVSTTPLAGTRALGEDILEEIRLCEELLSDSKEIAEHAISVYVAFDELERVCDPKSVKVVNFMSVSRRGSVQHLASHLTGRLSKHNNAWHAFQAVFPAVTSSGVPKKPSIDSICRFEPDPRGLYSGCVLTCDQSGGFDSALVLRSFYQKDGQTWLRAGAGIMNMSNPERELEETREKLRSCAFLVPSGD